MGAPTLYDIVDKTFVNNNGDKFVVKQTSVKNYRNQTQYLCVFESGWQCYAMSTDIRKGKVKDMLSPTVHGVGMLGNLGRSAIVKGKPYFLWLGIIRRCYDKTAPFYKWYGGNGVTVCDRWKRFDLFYEDYTKIDGYDKDKFEKGEIELDKDLKPNPNKVYSLETCTFVSHRENLEPVLIKRYGKQYLNAT